MAKSAKNQSSPIESSDELAVIENLKWVDRVLWAQITVGLTLLVAKLAGVTEFEWQHVKLNVAAGLSHI